MEKTIMEETKNTQTEQKEQQKLTYDQLNAFAQQTAEQAKKVFEENQILRQALSEANLNNNFREIECVLKCLDHADLFTSEFISTIVQKLEEVLTPKREETDTSDNKEE